MKHRRQSSFVQPSFVCFWLWWIAASTLGTTLALTVGAWLLGVLGSLLGTSFGALLLVSAAQALLIHKFVQPRRAGQRWSALEWFNYSLGAGVAGFLLAAPCAFVVIALGVPGYPSPAGFRNHAIAAAITSAIAWGSAGAAIGTAQNMLLRRYRRASVIWAPTSAIGWGALGAITVWGMLSTNFIDWPLPIFAVIVLSGLCGGAAHGAITGCALLALRRRVPRVTGS